MSGDGDKNGGTESRERGSEKKSEGRIEKVNGKDTKGKFGLKINAIHV